MWGGSAVAPGGSSAMPLAMHGGHGLQLPAIRTGARGGLPTADASHTPVSALSPAVTPGTLLALLDSLSAPGPAMAALGSVGSDALLAPLGIADGQMDRGPCS